jgi:hypothetical protein
MLRHFLPPPLLIGGLLLSDFLLRLSTLLGFPLLLQQKLPPPFLPPELPPISPPDMVKEPATYTPPVKARLPAMVPPCMMKTTPAVPAV